MKIALTGASGHLGGVVLKKLLEKGHQVKAMVFHDHHIMDQLPVEQVNGSVADIAALEKLMEGCDALIHCAGIISIHGDRDGRVRKTNVDGVRHVMEAARNAGIRRVVHISSIHAFNLVPCDQPMDETRESCGPNGHAYDQSKRDGQRIALSFQSDTMDVLVMNPTSMLGPPDYKPSLMGQAICDIYSRRIPALFKGGFDFVDVRDCADAIINALTMGTPGTNYLLSGKWYSLRELRDTIRQVSGTRIRIPFIPAWLARVGLPFIKLYAYLTGSEPLYTVESIDALVYSNRYISSARAKSELGFKPRPLAETLTDALAWYKDNHVIDQKR